MCVQRAIGTALAKHAISGGKKIALAFGCEDADQVRLHYSAAKEFVKHRRTGGIFKVDNSVGDKVEIMICDIKSYLVAMRYLLAFNKAEDIMYWDEPTVSMDYEDHDFHQLSRKTGTKTRSPISSSPVPLCPTLTKFLILCKIMWRDSQGIHSIVSNHSKNSVAILSQPRGPAHHLCETSEMTKCVQHCKTQSSLLRYMDLNEITKFLSFIRHNTEKFLRPGAPTYETYFDDIN